MKKILVYAYNEVNLGDDLFLKILFDRYPNVEWIVPNSKKTYKKIFRYKNVKIKPITLISRAINKFNKITKYKFMIKYDAVVFIGGSIFIEGDFWNDQYKFRKSIIEKFNRCDKPIFIIGSNFGPYKSEEFLDCYKKLLEKCTDICFREKYSYKLFKEFNNVRLEPDIVFSMKNKIVNKKSKSIGVSLIDLSKRKELKKYNNLYLNKIKEIIAEAINLEYKITLFSFCESEGDNIAIDNLITILEKENLNKVEVVSYSGDINLFLNKFASMENIIATRFHSLILSQIFNQGVYPIVYSNKTYNVLSDLMLDKEYIFIKDIEKLNSKHVINNIANNKITDKKIFKEAKNQFKGLDKYVEGIS